MRRPPPLEHAGDLGGHRVVRVLAQDDRALSLLVHGEGRTRVARVFDLTADPVSVERELAVLERAANAPPALREHVVALDEVFTLADGRVVALLQPVIGCRLAELLGPGVAPLTLGEAITVLAPIVHAVATAHELGLTGLPITPASIRFTATGAPVIVDVGRARLAPPLPAHYREAEPDYVDDRRALHALARQVASAVNEDGSAAIEAALVALGPQADLRAVADALFDLAAPAPIRIEKRATVPGTAEAAALADVPVRPAPVAALPARTDDRSAPGDCGVEDDPVDGGGAGGAARRAIGASLRALALPAGVVEPIERALATVTTLSVRLRTLVIRCLLSGRLRPRSVVVGVAGAVSLVLAATLASGPTDRGPAVAPDRPVPTPTGAAAGPTASASLHTGADAPERVPHPEPEQWPALVDALVARWVACRESVAEQAETHGAEGECDTVAHPASAAAALLLSVDPRHDALAEWESGGGSSVVVERMGGAVLVDLVGPTGETTAASLLLVRSEAGWRVRDVRL